MYYSLTMIQCASVGEFGIRYEVCYGPHRATTVYSDLQRQRMIQVRSTIVGTAATQSMDITTGQLTNSFGV